MNTTVKRMSARAALGLSAGICAGLFGHRAFDRLVERDVRALFAQSPARRVLKRHLSNVIYRRMIRDLTARDSTADAQPLLAA